MQVIEAVAGPILVNLGTEQGPSYWDRIGEHEIQIFWAKHKGALKRKLSSTNFGKYVRSNKSVQVR